MKVSESDLRNKYSELEDSELISLSKKNNLTDEAKEILYREIKQRNIDLHAEMPTGRNSSPLEKRNFKSRIKSAAYGFLSGILIGSSILSSSITNHDFTLIAEVYTRVAIGVFIGISLFAVSIFLSEKTAKKLMMTGLAMFLGYFLLTFIFK